MDYTTAGLVLTGIILIIVYLWHCYTFWDRCGIPTAKGVLPIFGNVFSVLTMRKSFSEHCRQLYETHKGKTSMLGFYNMGNPALLVLEPELVKTVLSTNFTSFHSNSSTVDEKVDPLLAKDPFFNDGENWVNGRKRLQQLFSTTKLKFLHESILGACKKFDNFLEKRLKPSDKYEVELKDLFSRFTGETVANAGLGIEGNCFADEIPPFSFHEIGQRFLKPSIKNGIGFALIVLFPRLNRLLKMKFVPKEIEDFFRRTVKQILAERRKENVVRPDFFYLSLEYEKSRDEPMSEEDLAGQAFAFFLDGYETSSITLSFVGYYLAVHQDVQEKLREEVMRVYSKYNDTITYESLKEMKYMDQVISESQRLYPALGTLIKICTKECTLTGTDGKTCHVKPGTDICLPIHGIHTDPRYWTNPTVFDPERFNEEKKKEIYKFAFLPFSDGPRSCVGMRIAILQMKSCLATLLLKHRLELSPKTQTPFKLSPCTILSIPVGGIWVYIKPL